MYGAVLGDINGIPRRPISAPVQEKNTKAPLKSLISEGLWSE